MKKLELLVTLDIKLSATAKLAHYVIAPKLSLEVPGLSVSSEGVEQTYVAHGYPEPYAQYTPAIVVAAAGLRRDRGMGVLLRPRAAHGLPAHLLPDARRDRRPARAARGVRPRHAEEAVDRRAPRRPDERLAHSARRDQAPSPRPDLRRGARGPGRRREARARLRRPRRSGERRPPRRRQSRHAGRARGRPARSPDRPARPRARRGPPGPSS